MDGTRDAIQHLEVELREHEGLVHARLADVALRRSIHHVPDVEALHCLVLGHATGAVRATDNGGVSTAVLGPTVVPALGGHGATGEGETDCCKSRLIRRGVKIRRGNWVERENGNTTGQLVQENPTMALKFLLCSSSGAYQWRRTTTTHRHQKNCTSLTQTDRPKNKATNDATAGKQDHTNTCLHLHIDHALRPPSSSTNLNKTPRTTRRLHTVETIILFSTSEASANMQCAQQLFNCEDVEKKEPAPVTEISTAKSRWPKKKKKQPPVISNPRVFHQHTTLNIWTTIPAKMITDVPWAYGLN